MEFVTFSNPSRLEQINAKALESADSVEAAIAYATDEDTLIKKCFELDVPLKLYGRYDYSQPVSVEILNRFLHKRSANFVFRFVPDVLHAKVIWWHGVTKNSFVNFNHKEADNRSAPRGFSSRMEFNDSNIAADRWSDCPSSTKMDFRRSGRRCASRSIPACFLLSAGQRWRESSIPIIPSAKQRESGESLG